MAASNPVVVAWDAATGKQEWTYRNKGTNVFGLAISPDGTRVAVGISRQVKILDAKTGNEISTLGGAAHFVFRIAFSPDGKCLAASSGSSNNTGEGWVDIIVINSQTSANPTYSVLLNDGNW